VIEVEARSGDVVENLRSALAQALQELTDAALSVAAKPQLPHFRSDDDNAVCRNSHHDQCDRGE